MKKILAIAGALAIATAAYAASGRAEQGYKLTHLLNGSPVYKGVVAAYDGGFADNSTTVGTTFGLDETSFIFVQCEANAWLAARPAGNADGGTTAARSLRLDPYEKFPVGLLQPGMAKVSVSPTDGGRVDCKYFEVK